MSFSKTLASIACFSLAAIVAGGCSPVLVLNPAFVNQQTGEVFPLVPRTESAFVLARCNNTTNIPVEFLVTGERVIDSPTQPGTAIVDPVTTRIFVPPVSTANDLGVLFDCPVVRVGLGENLDRPTSEPGIFINAEAVGVGGFGVPANVNPLDVRAGNFECGDTIVFQATPAANAVGGVIVRSFVLDQANFTTDPIGRDTFVNAREFVEEQRNLP